MEIKIQCGCGTKYKFDVEPVNGRMPFQVQCPTCGSNGTTDANQILSERFKYASASPGNPAPSVAVAAQPSGLRIAGGSTSAVAEPETSAPSSYRGGGSLLQHHTYLVKEHVGLLKLTDTYDILDPASGQPLGVAREEPPMWAKLLRLAVNKSTLPTAINIYAAEGQPPLVSIHRGFTFLRSKVHVVSGDGRKLGYFRSKLLSLGGGFLVFDHAEQQLAEVKGDWKGWNFRFLNKHGREIGTVTKKWAGLAKELFTSADNYVIALTDPGNASPDTNALLLAAGLAIDMVYKETE